MTAVAPPVAMTGGEAVVRALQAHGVELVLGIPGTHTLPIHRHLTASGIGHVTPRHEQPDLPRLGEAFGGAGVRADGPAELRHALREALERPGPTVIEVPGSA